MCSIVPAGCSTASGDAVYPLSGNGGIIPVDAIFPITVGVYNRATGTLDTNFHNYGYVDQLTGPGNMYGTLSMYGKKWLTFTDIRFDAVGVYTVKLSTAGNVIPDTVTIQVVAPTKTAEINSNKVNVYPNPFTDFVNIKTKEGALINAI